MVVCARQEMPYLQQLGDRPYCRYSHGHYHLAAQMQEAYLIIRSIDEQYIAHAPQCTRQIIHHKIGQRGMRAIAKQACPHVINQCGGPTRDVDISTNSEKHYSYAYPAYRFHLHCFLKER